MSTTATPDVRATLTTTLDPVVARVAARKDAWVREDVPARIAYLEACKQGLLDIADEWVRAGCHAKGIDPASPRAGEEWFSGPMATVRHFRLMVNSLRANGQPRPLHLKQRANGQWVAHVFPPSLLKRIVYSDMTVEVWMQPGKPPSQGRIYRDKAEGVVRPGRVCLVLGAGNQSSIGPLDVVYKLFAEDEVVVLKLNPVNEYLAPMFRRAFRSLIDAGYLDIVQGGVDVGKYLCDHPDIHSIHLTGSETTHDAIVWGETAEEQEQRKAAGRPRIDKTVTSELGCVTPVLVVPGRWSRGDLKFQARNVASMVAHNASFNCNAAKALVLARGWDQREAFLEELHTVFARLPARRAYYPGAEERYQRFREHYPNARVLGPTGPHVVPWTVLPNVPPNAGEYALTREAFCAVLAETSLDVDDAETFLREAVAFVNEHVWGTLSCVVIADGRTQRRHRAQFEQALADLRYGDIGVNVWTGANYALGVATWGAFPGNTLDNVRSGIGVVHNTKLFDYPEKSICRGPFRLWPTPVWFADHRNLAELGRRATWFESNPTWASLPSVAWAGMKG
jgi:hypothetical protein